jgi:hypothetical protein
VDPTVPTPPPQRERSYPIPAPSDDKRFSFGLMLDVAQVLLDHGYPRVSSGGDLRALQQALFGFLYVPVSEHLGNDPTGLGFSREPDEVKPTSAVPAHVDGHSEFSGRASVPGIEPAESTGRSVGVFEVE